MRGEHLSMGNSHGPVMKNLMDNGHQQCLSATWNSLSLSTATSFEGRAVEVMRKKKFIASANSDLNRDHQEACRGVEWANDRGRSR